jgi:excisionase family DNA binding protein
MPDDYLTVDEVAAQLAVPLEMIQRRIESGDIPVHWVEIGGKLEMRISAAEIGVSQPAESTPFPTPGDFTTEEGETPPPASDEGPARGWAVRDPEYDEMWSAPEDQPTPAAPQANTPWEPGAEDEPAAAAAPPRAPWGPSPESEPSAPEAASPAEPVWRQDPQSWEDEPLKAGAASEPPPGGPAEYNPAGTDSYFPLETEATTDYPTPPPPITPGPFSQVTSMDEEDDEEASPFGSDEEDEEEQAIADEEEVVTVAEEEDFVAIPDDEEAGALVDDQEDGALVDDEEEGALVGTIESLEIDSPLTSDILGGPQLVEVPRPSALAAAQGPESALAINSIDARELVAGLFERWERALEQRIQAEQRLRFEAELERRLRQVRDLRQELDNTRKSTAAQLAEREQEVMALRNRLREEGPAPKGRGLGIFRRQ